MKLLALETATEACSVALYLDGEVIERFEVAPRRHAELALPWAEQLLADAGVAKSQLDAIAVGRGPGAFTGVRLAVALAQGMALALDRPVLSISTLRALASQAEGEHVLAAIDARMGEIYVASYRRDGAELLPLGSEVVVAPADYVPPPIADGWVGVGTGFGAAEACLQASLASNLRCVDAGALPHAADVARLAVLAHARGEGVAPEFLEPAYLRNNVALTLAEQQALRASR